jgi:RNA polymerase sigma factor (sigma-70 family)
VDAQLDAEFRDFMRARWPVMVRLAYGLTGSPPESASDADATRRYDDRSALVAALQRLGPRRRAVIVLRYWLDLTEAEAAAALNCSAGTVKSQTSRALAALRRSAELVEGGPSERRPRG